MLPTGLVALGGTELSATIGAGASRSDADLIRGLMGRGTERSFAVGDLLMRQGDVSSSLFYIVSGRVAVERSSADTAAAVVLAEIGAGELVGELGVLEGRVRSATVRAIEPTRAIELGRDVALKALAEQPQAALRVMKQLAERLRAMDDLASKGRQ